MTDLDKLKKSYAEVVSIVCSECRHPAREHGQGRCWGNHYECKCLRSEYDVVASELAQLRARLVRLERALNDIIAEQPNPTLPYGKAIVQIASAALKELQ